jgi:hypothetical protein
MQRLLPICAFSACLGFSALAAAQDEDPEAAVRHTPPPAHRGFQMALRTGFSMPFGKVEGEGDTKMSDFVSGQVPLFVEIGGKPIKNLFIGGYMGVAFGGTAGDTSDLCDASDIDCIAVSTRLGAEIQYHILPDQDLNPWIGYGFGFESVSIAITKGDEDGTVTNGGFEFGHFMAGLDFRITRVFGVGPFVDFSLGRYYRYRVDAPGLEDVDRDHDETAFHEWLTLGARFVFFP